LTARLETNILNITGQASIVPSPTLPRLASPAEATTAKKIIEGIQIFLNAKKVVHKIQTPSNVLISRKTPHPRRIDGGWDLSLVNGRRKEEEEEGRGGRRTSTIF